MLLNLAPKKAIIIAPHADDEVLGAGGFMAAAQFEGWELHVLYATISGYPSAARCDQSQTEARVSEVERACKVLNVSSWEAFSTGENLHLRLDTIPQSDLISFIERAVFRIRPSIVVVPCRGHYHQDHRALADACVAALRPAPDGPRPFVPCVIAYGHSGAGWGGEFYDFRPNLFFDIKHVIDLKLQALACYESQLCDPPHPRGLEAVRNYCATWGAFNGVAYAEPFECLRLVTGRPSKDGP